jgi:hypothetical protein
MTLVKASFMPVSAPAFRHMLGGCGRASTGSTGAGAVTGSLSYGEPKVKQHEASQSCLSRIIMRWYCARFKRTISRSRGTVPVCNCLTPLFQASPRRADCSNRTCALRLVREPSPALENHTERPPHNALGELPSPPRNSDCLGAKTAFKTMSDCSPG